MPTTKQISKNKLVASPGSFLIIQTAFTGDVILATALIEKLHAQYPEAAIDFLLRKGNEGLFRQHPFLRNVHVWDKKNYKLKNLRTVIQTIRALRYDYVINVHRFISSGFVTLLSRAKVTIGFNKNPLSIFFSKKVKHTVDKHVHEVDRNQRLIEDLTDITPARPKLYPSDADYEHIKQYRELSTHYLCIAPTSVWFTKQFPKEKWIAFSGQPELQQYYIFLLGAPADERLCESICLDTKHPHVINLAGKLDFLESSALIKGARMNFVNDSAPLHLASSMNAPVTAVYCSTVPAFGFGPLSDQSDIVETTVALHCRPCGLHGYRMCPEGHFKCALTIGTEQLISALKN